MKSIFKTKLLKILFLLISIHPILTFSQEIETQILDVDELFENSSEINETKRAEQLNYLLEQQLVNLEKVNSTLQYIGQSINKGSISIKNKIDALDWIKEHQLIIKKIESTNTLPLSEIKLYITTLTTKLLIIHVIKVLSNLSNNIEEFPSFNLPKFISEPVRSDKKIKISKIDQNNYEAQNLIQILRNDANNLGLTTTNKIARKLDEINEKYNITKNLEYLPLAGFLGATAIYFTPKRYLDNLPVFSKLKGWIGTSDLSEPSKNDDKSESKGLYKKFINLSNSDDFKALTKVGGLFAAMHIAKEPLSPITSSVRESISKWWDKLKGYKVENTDTYKIIDNITLDDERLIGLDSQIKELENLVKYIINPEVYDKSNSNLEKGILLVGPSRNGKTFAAKALAGTLNKTLSLKGHNSRFGFREIKWGEAKWSSEGIKTLIEEAKRNAPCILFLDEIHNLPLQTKEGGETLTEFLTGMSGINSENDSRHQVILLAATNQPEMLDSALLQPGRFGTIIRFEKPNYQNRKKYFQMSFKRNAIDDSNIDTDSLVRQTVDCSYGDLETIVKSARFIAQSQAKGITQKHLQDRIDTHVHRFKDEFSLSDLETNHLSINKSGQAFMHISLNPIEQLELVSIKGIWPKIKEKRHWEDNLKKEISNPKKAKYGVLITYNPSEALEIKTKEDKEKLCKIKLSGAIAEKIILGSMGIFESKSKSSHFNNDKIDAFKIAKSILYEGLSEKDLPKEIVKELNFKAFKLLSKYENEIKITLEKNKHKIENLAQALKNKKTLTVNQIREIVNS